MEHQTHLTSAVFLAIFLLPLPNLLLSVNGSSSFMVNNTTENVTLVSKDMEVSVVASAQHNYFYAEITVPGLKSDFAYYLRLTQVFLSYTFIEGLFYAYLHT